MQRRLEASPEPWDLLIVGGGATGVGAAVDAATRGYRVLLLEQSDFGKGTSSRSTKLVHGGVRYLQQGNVSLVMEALEERGILRRNAPHLVHDLRFIVPTYDWWEGPFYGIGMRVYDLLAGKYGFGRSRRLSRAETLAAIPTLTTEGLRGGVQYYDGQFDDARLLVHLARTAVDHGATLLNYVRVTGFLKDAEGLVQGVAAVDQETGRTFDVRARCVINATGAFADSVRRFDDPQASAMIAPSQGVHVVLDGTFLPGDSAIMVPRTRDKRVMFAIPWHGHTLLGTTDTPIDVATLEPVALEDEIDFLLETASRYLVRDPARADIRSIFAGVRPLVRAAEGKGTAALSRDHTIHIANSGLLTIIGGKWTTYRRMAEDCVNQAATLARLDERPCVTKDLRIHGAPPEPADVAAAAEPGHRLRYYGSDAAGIEALEASDPALGARLDAALPYTVAEAVWAVRHEMARTVDDVVSRRLRALQLDAAAALRMAPAVAAILAGELRREASWPRSQVEAFTAMARNYLPRDGRESRSVLH